MGTAGKALIAMSGGVDSSVAAILTQQDGYDCIGATMRLIGNGKTPETSEPGGEEEFADAVNAARRLGIPHYIFDFTKDFSERVICRFIRAYEEGRTPNPCVDCNRFMKFGKLLEKAETLGCDYIVTGHYARIRYDEMSGRWQLLRGQNREKDQSYVLCFMTQEQLAHMKLPLGTFAGKEEVRGIARKYGLENAERHDSQDICFVPDGDYASFIRRYTGKEYPEGNFIGPEGEILGRHRGMIRYTIGQRKGLGLSLPSPLYVKEKDIKNNCVILGPEASLYTRGLTAEDVNWISIAPPDPGTVIEVSAKTRYRAKEAFAECTVLDNGSVHLVFKEPQRAVTPGQILVMYDGEKVIGGGTILR